MVARHYFIKGLIHPPSSPQSVAQSVANKKATPNETTVSPTKCLKGLHLTPYELYQGIKFATQMPEKSKGAREFLLCLGEAWGRHFGNYDELSLDQVKSALIYGHWSPSLSDLFSTNIFTWDSFEFMPEGIVCISWGGLDVPKESTRTFRKMFCIHNNPKCSNEFVEDIFSLYPEADVTIQKKDTAS